MICILLAEDMHMTREALAALLGLEPDIEVVAEVARGDAVVPAALAHHPNVAVLDLGMPGADGLSAARDLGAALPDCRILILTALSRPEALRSALAARVGGFMLDAQPDQLAPAIPSARWSHPAAETAVRADRGRRTVLNRAGAHAPVYPFRMSMQGVGDTEGDWAGLFVGIEALAASPSMRQAWLSGLSYVAPADVVPKLLDVVSSLAVLDLPAEAIDAAIAYPNRKIRSRLAEHRRDMSIDQWVRLIASETAGADRRRSRWFATWYCPKVPAAEFERWARDPDPRTRLQALWFRGLPQRLALALAADPDPEVRAEACEYAWPYLDARRRSALVDDPSPQVQEVARQRAGYDRPMSRTEFDALTTAEQWRAVPVQRLERDLAEHLVRHGERGLRENLVGDERLDADLINELAHDEDPHVRASVVVRADVTEELRASISAGLPPDTPYWRVGWVEAVHDDPEAMRRLASSASIGIRRSVARARHLPSDVVDRLSRDPDTSVQYNLASCCQDAPAELLLEVALRPTGSFLDLNHPNFPHHTLLRLADDPDPLRRRLALESPDSTPGLAERFADDPDERVRARAAADPRLSPATALHLLDSTPRTRRAAIGNPKLPIPTLIRLLRDADTARDAAANPAIPTTVVRHLIELSCAAEPPSG